MKKKYRNYLFFIVGIIFLLILGGVLFWQSKSSLPEPSETNISLSDKSSTFKVSGNKAFPAFRKISFDPFEAKGGERQKLVAVLGSESLITSVYAEVEDEIGKRNIDLTFVKNEKNESYWQGEWEIKMTKEKEYPVTFFVENDNGKKNQITLLWQAKEEGELGEQGLIDKLKYGLREIKIKIDLSEVLAGDMNELVSTSKDHFPHSGNTAINTNIALSSSDFLYTGIDGGSLTINSGITLQLNSDITFIFNPGQSISPVGNIVLADGAEIRKGYLWMEDSDDDGCAICANPSDVVYTTSSTSPGVGWVRVKDIEYYPDPDDGSAGDAPSCVTIYTLSVSKTGSGTITSNPTGISCGSDCSQTYNYGTSVTLTAIASTGYTFTGWSGACTGIGACTISMTANRSVTANFVVTCTPNSYKSCYNNDVYWYDSCGSSASCFANTSWKDYENCGSDYCNSWGSNYCSGGDVYHQRTCYSRGCSGTTCYLNSYTDTQKVQDCSYCCSSGSCTGVCSPGSTQSCSDSCSYKYCNGSSCVTKTNTKNGTRTCSSSCYWGGCSASASCPASSCSTNSDCGPQIVEHINVATGRSCNQICDDYGKTCVDIRSYGGSGYYGRYFTPYDSCSGWTSGGCGTPMNFTSWSTCAGSRLNWCYCRCQ